MLQHRWYSQKFLICWEAGSGAVSRDLSTKGKETQGDGKFQQKHQGYLPSQTEILPTAYNCFPDIFRNKYPLPHTLTSCILFIFLNRELRSGFNFLPFQTEESFVQFLFKLEDSHRQPCDPLLCRQPSFPLLAQSRAASWSGNVPAQGGAQSSAQHSRCIPAKDPVT